LIKALISSFHLHLVSDPLGLGQRLCGDDEKSKQVLQTIEVVNGRIAMLATVGYVVQEYITGEMKYIIFHAHDKIFYFIFLNVTMLGLPVVSETPQFFSFQ
jgi:hypothetical protein